MTDNELLLAVVAKLDRGDAPAFKSPDRKGEYSALCPYHKDTHTGNFFVSERGYRCFSCGAQGGLRRLAQKLDIAVARLRGSQTDNNTVYSLARYAQDKQLPEAFLRSLGLSDRKYSGAQALRIPYRDEAGQEVTCRFRIAAQGDKFRWKSGSKTMLYGLDRLSPSEGYVYLVEGESDCHTLWYYDEPALGAPGAATWKPEWARFLDGKDVFVWQEPGDAGAKFVRSIGASIPNCKIITAPADRKDISACHLAGNDVPALLTELRASARPYREIQTEQTSNEAEAAKKKAASLLTAPDILAEFQKLCDAQGLVGEERTAKLLYLALTTRLLERPVSVVIKGPSSGGKSFTAETVLHAFPANAYYSLSSMSERSLAYSQEPLVNRFLVLYEAAGMGGDMATYLMRTLLSEGCIRYETVEKTSEGLKPKLIERAGPTGLLVTTTAAQLHPENETRMFSVTIQDTREQTKGILGKLADRANGREPRPVDFSPWHALQTWLQLAGSREVTIPYAHELAEHADARSVRLRRDFGAILNMIRAHAILHQETRRRDDYGRIVATFADYEAVYELVNMLVSVGVQATVSKETRETVEAVASLNQESGGLGVNNAAVGKLLDLDKGSVSRRVSVALRDGYLVNLQDKKGQPNKLVVGEPLPAESSVLPTPAKIKSLLSPRTTAQPCNPAGVPAQAEEWGDEGAEDADSDGVEAWQRAFAEEADRVYGASHC